MTLAHPYIGVRKNAYGQEAFSTVDLPSGTLVLTLIDLIASSPCTEWDPKGVGSIQIASSLWLVETPEGDVGDFVNHSCDPNVELRFERHLISLRPIERGEAITLDYRKAGLGGDLTFVCRCVVCDHE